MNGCEHSTDPLKTASTSQHMSRLIVSHPRRGVSLRRTAVSTGWGLICRVVISSVLVLTRDAIKHTSPEVCIPTATCHFSHRGHKSCPEARMTTQSHEHDTSSKLFLCLFDLVAHWTLAEQESCLVELKRYKSSAFAVALLYLHLTETSSVALVSSSLRFTRSFCSQSSKDVRVMQFPQPEWKERQV